MSPELGLVAARIALFLIVGAGLSLLLVTRDSAEFVVLVLTIGIGLAMLGIVALLARIGAPRWDPPGGRRHGSLLGEPPEDGPAGADLAADDVSPAQPPPARRPDRDERG